MLSCSIWFSVPSFWIGCGLDSRCVGHVLHQVGISSYFMRKMHGQTTLIAQPSTLRFQARILEESVQLPIMSAFSLLHIHTAKACMAYRYDLLQLIALVTHIM